MKHYLPIYLSSETAKFAFRVSVSVLSLAIYFFYGLTLQRLLRTVRPEHRTIQSNIAWLFLVPITAHFALFVMGANIHAVPVECIDIVNPLFCIFLVWNISASLHNEFASRLMRAPRRPLFYLGLATYILNGIAIVPGIGIIATFAGFICWIILWVKANQYKNELLYSPDNANESMIFGNQNQTM
jgi:hypothetical protein